MENISVRRLVIFVSTLFLITSAMGSEPGFEQHGAHVHGVGKLMIAEDGNQLEIQFVSPGMNIVGFEHLPSNAAQKAAISKAIDTLKQPLRLFGFAASAGCKTVSAKAQIGKEQHHEDEMDHEEEGEHHDEHEGHSEFSATYRLACTNLSRVEGIEVNIFKLFPATRVIKVEAISDRGQKQMDLTPANTTLEF